MGTWESSETPENSEFNCRGQNTLPWSVFYIVGKVLKWKCRKWPCMSHSDIYNTMYVRKKGQESNWQFDSSLVCLLTTKSQESTRPRCLKVECNTPLERSWGELQVCLKFHPDRRAEQGIMNSQNPRVQTGTISGLLLGSLGKKCHSDVGAAGRHREYYMGERDGLPWVRAMVNHVNLGSPMACPNIESAPECELTNLLVSFMQVWVTK
jgi:hypothetical protein